MASILSIDPSGTGMTGICLINSQIIFQEFQHQDWKEHYAFISQVVKDYQPAFVLYENTNYLYSRQHQGTVSLLKLLGAIESLPLRAESILVKQVKDLKAKLFKDEIQIKDLEFKLGKGWFFQKQKISIHQLDAYLVYFLWKEKGGGE